MHFATRVVFVNMCIVHSIGLTCQLKWEKSKKDMRSQKTLSPPTFLLLFSAQNQKCIRAEFILGEVSQAPSIGKGENEQEKIGHLSKFRRVGKTLPNISIRARRMSWVYNPALCNRSKIRLASGMPIDIKKKAMSVTNSNIDLY